MNIYKFELKMYLRSVMIWSASIAALIFVFMAFYPAMAADTALLDQILENYPPELLKAFGMNTGISLASVPGFFTFVFVFVQLCAAIQASNYGFHFLSVEERELTADFLMSKPVSRMSIITGKFFAALTALTITNAFIWLGSVGSVEVFRNGNTYDMSNMIILLCSVTFLQLFFLCVGMLISVMVKKIRSVLSFSMALAFGLYTLNALAGIVDSPALGLLTPFRHFEPGYILSKGGYDTPMLMLSLGIIMVSLAGSFILYIRRDIASV